MGHFTKPGTSKRRRAAPEYEDCPRCHRRVSLLDAKTLRKHIGNDGYPCVCRVPASASTTHPEVLANIRAGILPPISIRK